MALRDRLLTRAVAEAMMSPSAIVLTGAGAAVGVLAGLGPIGAVVGGMVAWLARVAAAVPRGGSRPAIRPERLLDPWRRFVREAIEAEDRFKRTVRKTRAGPLRERLAAIGTQIERSVDECWAIAQRAQELTDARRSIEADRIAADLTALPPTASPAEREALEAQLASARRLEAVVQDANDRLRVLDARLDEAVARAVELSVQAPDVTELEGVDALVGDVVLELEALRAALDESSSSASSIRAPGSSAPVAGPSSARSSSPPTAPGAATEA